MTADISPRPNSPPMPRIAMVLLGAALVDVALLFWRPYLFQAYPDVSVPIVAGNLLSALPFVLAASIAAGWRRWMAGREWLTAATAAFAAAGTLNAASQLGLAVILAGDLPPNTASVTAASTGAMLSSLAGGGATLLAAAGVWRGSPSQVRAGWHARASRIAIAGAVLVTIAATVTAARVLYAYASLDSADVGPISYMRIVVFELASVPLAVLGVVAIRRMPNRYFVPELLIGVGALAASVMWRVWSASIFFVSSPSPSVVSEGVVATAILVQLLVTVVVALGFFAARVSAPGEA